MYLGKPVIATGYGGVTDFLDDETGFVVRHRPAALERPPRAPTRPARCGPSRTSSTPPR